MDGWHDLIQLGMTSVQARQALLGTNRALNRSTEFLDGLADDLFTEADLGTINRTYERIPEWKRKLDLLDGFLDQLAETATDLYDGAAFVHDFKELMNEIDEAMSVLAKALQRNRH